MSNQTPSTKTPSLQLSQKQMRELGDRVMEILINHFVTLRDKPVSTVATRDFLESRLREPLPETPSSMESLLEIVKQEVLGNITHMDHPRCFAYVPGPNNFVSVMADALASGFNVFAGSWLEASGPAMIELVVIDWIRQLCGLPEHAGGLLVGGGSIANLMALDIARQVKLGRHSALAMLYCSDQTHSSVMRAARILGFGPEQLRVLTADAQFQLPLDSLYEAISADRSAGRIPLCVIANAGSTSTGSIDDLKQLVDLCRAQQLWLHIDAAYGGAAVLCCDALPDLAAVAAADTIIVDPHKGLFQPYEAACLLVREARWLSDTYRVVSAYGKDEELGIGEVNYCDLGVQLSRRFNALKLWLSLKFFGLSAFRAGVAHTLDLARVAERELLLQPELELTSRAQLGILTFRYQGAIHCVAAQDALNRRIVTACIRDGYTQLSSTELHGKVVLRVCFINPTTTETDVRLSIRKIAEIGRALEKEANA